MTATKKALTFTPFKLSPHGRWGSIENIAAATKAAEDLGYESINMPDHLILPHNPKDPPLQDELWYDNFVLGAHLASITKRIRLRFFVLIVPYRPPILTAKQLATLDVLSKGRVTLGTGVGWMKGEFELLGIPYDRRGAITDEYLQAFRVLWSQEHPEFHGKFVNFSNARFEPKPVQTPIPMWIGGTGPWARRRAVQLGQGWMPMAGNVEELGKEAEIIKGMLMETGRDPDTFDFSFQMAVGEQPSYTPHPSAAQDMGHRAQSGAPRRGPLPLEAGPVIEAVAKYRDCGFNHIYVNLGWNTHTELIKNMEWFAAKVMPAFKPVGAATR